MSFYKKKINLKIELYDAIFLVDTVDSHWETPSTLYKNLGRTGEPKARGRGHYTNGGH